MNKLERARDTITRLENRSSLSSRQKSELERAQRTVRRRTMKLFGLGAAAITLAGTGLAI